MDNSPTQVAPTTPLQSPTEPIKPSNPRGLLITLIVLEVVTLLVAGYFGYQYSQLKKRITTTQATPPSTTNLESSASPAASLPAGWGYKLSQQQKNANDCVKFALPPMVEPYVYTLDENRQPSVTEDKGSGRFWYLGGGTYPNLLSKIIPNGQEYRQTMAIFATEIEASGYISQAVAVSCIPNDSRYSNNAAIITALTTELDKYNSSTGEKGMEASTYKIKINTPTTRWGKSVADLVVTEDATDVKYTLFVTPQYIYEVRMLGASSDSFVKETAQKIFNNLLFN